MLFANRSDYEAESHRLLKILGGCSCVVTLKEERQLKRLEGIRSVSFTEDVFHALQEAFGPQRVAVQEKNVKYLWSSGFRSSNEEAAPSPDSYDF